MERVREHRLPAERRDGAERIPVALLPRERAGYVERHDVAVRRRHLGGGHHEHAVHVRGALRRPDVVIRHHDEVEAGVPRRLDDLGQRAAAVARGGVDVIRATEPGLGRGGVRRRRPPLRALPQRHGREDRVAGEEEDEGGEEDPLHA
jgi:hypothetical protein